jgi:hypothetical protein
MQVVLNFKNVMVGTALLAAGYYGYKGFAANVETDDVGKLLRNYRQAPPAHRILIRRRILSLYDSGRDCKAVVRALDSPSPLSQALAVEVLAAKHERGTAPRLLAMLDEPDRDDIVKEKLAEALAAFGSREAIPRLIELTDTAEARDVRIAAHTALQALTGAGAGIKFGDATRQHWTLWWRDHATRAR